VTIVLVDGENVRRSRWPNVARDELEQLVRTWAEARGVDAEVVWEGPKSADDLIAERAADMEDELWLVTSDRGLRARVPGAARTIGGGAFLGELG
jgi:hypothetical protein